MRRRRRSQSEAESSASKVNEATKPSMFRHFKVVLATSALISTEVKNVCREDRQADSAAKASSQAGQSVSVEPLEGSQDLFT